MFWRKRQRKTNWQKTENTKPPDPPSPEIVVIEGVEFNKGDNGSGWSGAAPKPIANIVNYYGSISSRKKDEPHFNIPVVIIYNYEQLAAEIAKHLKDKRGDGNQSNDNGGPTSDSLKEL